MSSRFHLRIRFLILGFWTAAALGQSFTPPLAGLLRGSDSRVRPVFGIAGNFFLGEARIEGALSLAFSGRFGLVKTADAVLTLDSRGEILASSPAPEGDALFAFDAQGVPARAYFGATGELRDLPAEGRSGLLASFPVVALGRSETVVFRDRRLWRSGVPVSADEFDAPPPALLTPAGDVLFVAGREVVVVSPGGEERRVALDTPCARIEQMSEDWVLLAPAVALRLRDAKTFRLPEAAP